jgi:toxin-antitoxin system PIN domain toxin
VLVDTNVVVYAARREAPEHGRCRAVLDRLRADWAPWHLSWGVIYEFLRVTTHSRVAERPLTISQAMAFVDALLASPSLTVLAETERHAAVLAGVAADVPGLAGNLVHDAHLVALMREHGVRRILTRDSDFHRFPGVDVVNPLRG